MTLNQGGTAQAMNPLLRQAQATGATAAVVLFILAAVACGGDTAEFEWPDDPPSPTAQPAQSSPSLDPAQIEAVEEILTVVHGYRQAELKEYSDPQAPQLARPAFSDYLADPLLSQILTALNNMYENGVVYEGRFSWEPQVTDLRLEETPPTATIRDCVDATGWRSVFAESGNPVSGKARPDEHVAWFKAMLYPQGWLLYEGGIRDGELC